MCRRDDFGQNLPCVENFRVAHQWQLNEFLDGPASKLMPDSIVFALHLIAGWMRRPVRAAAAEIFEADLHGAVALIQRGVKSEAQTRDDSDIVAAFGALHEHQ